MNDTIPNNIEVRNFETYIPLMKAVDEDPATGDYVVSGPVASEVRDLEGETMVRSGIWKSLQGFFRDYGAHVDWEHKYVKDHDPKWIIGRGKDAISVDGRPYLAARLFKANPLVESIVSLIKSGSRLGYSILGSGARDRVTKTVMPTSIKFVTIAPIPMGVDQFIQLGTPSNGIVQLSKALCYDDEYPGLDSGWHSPDERELQMLYKSFSTNRPNGQKCAAADDHASRWDRCSGRVSYVDGGANQGGHYCEKHKAEFLKWLGRDEEPDNVVNGQANPALHDDFNKAFTAGSGIVTAGTTGGAAMRTQELGDEDEESKPCGCKGDKKCKKHARIHPVTDLEKALFSVGVQEYHQVAVDLSRYLRSARG